MITLQELLNLKTDLFKNNKTKLVRHIDHRAEYKDFMSDYRKMLNNREKVLDYQRRQSKEVFKDTKYIISFIGMEGTRSLLFGIFKVNDDYKKEGKNFIYDLEELKEFSDLYNRIIIDWGKATIKWHQWYEKNPKEIVEIIPKGYLGLFPGLTRFVLTFNELERLIKNPDANKEWKMHLSSVNGIYLILDTKTGMQYVGSAYGKDGIWGRWSDYVMTKHGNNKELKILMGNDPDYYKNFQFTILEALPSNMHAKEVVQIENLYKEKLGSRAKGLNAN